MFTLRADSKGVPLKLARPGAGRGWRGTILVSAAALAVTLAPGPMALAEPAPSPSSPPAPTATNVDPRGHTESSVVALTTTSGRSTAERPANSVATGFTTVVDLLPGTQMVALTWEAAPSGPDGRGSGVVSVRPVGDDGPWIERDGDGREGEQRGNGREGTELIWLGSEGADAVEVRVDVGPLVDLELMRMRHTPSTTSVGRAAPAGTAAASGRSTAMPTIRPRSDWASGGWKYSNSGCGGGPIVADRLDHLIIHHTAGSNAYSAADVPAILDGVYRYHTAGRGWCDIAYNYLVDRFGTIWQGRTGPLGDAVVGGHTSGFNTGSLGVALMGQFQPGASPAAAAPTTAMLDSTARLLAWLADRHGLDPRGTTTVTSKGGGSRYASGTRVTLPVIGVHRDTGYTECPGDSVVAQMPAVRDAVAAYVTDTPTQPDAERWAPFPTVEDLVWRQYSDVLGHPGTYESRLWWHNSIREGTTNKNALVASLVDSAEAQDERASAVRLYLAYFERVPDHDGIRYWWDQRDAGTSLRRISQAFTFTPEFNGRYGRLTNSEFVRLVYRNVLGRDAEASGLTYWTGVLDTGHDNRGGVMAQFSESAENKAGRDVTVDVIVVHETMLGRAISSSSLTSWSSQVRRNGIGDLIGTIYASSEYATRVGA